MRWTLPAFAALLLLSGLSAAAEGGFARALSENASGSLTYLEKSLATPRFYQSDPRAGFPNGGRDYCCPVAISNSLICLARQGCAGLAPTDEATALQSQIALIKTLASPDYCGTDPEEGTPPRGLLQGVRRYVEEKGYRCLRLEYEGWRSVGSAQQSAIKAIQPDLAWLKAGIASPRGAVWLNVGWYVATGAAGEWKRTGGHWVTLVGYGPEVLLVHNPARPAPTSDSAVPDDSVSLTLLTEGEAKSSSGANRSLAGSYQVTGPGLPVRKGVQAVLDTAVVLVVGPHSP